MIQSPCVKICVMNPAAGICTGCGRTLDEIARWGAMSDAERVRVMNTLPTRLGNPNQNKIVIPGERE
jgi:predicted Fe-S protein YdhL (DUF1289 family)